jgi:hypothetical protein
VRELIDDIRAGVLYGEFRTIYKPILAYRTGRCHRPHGDCRPRESWRLAWYLGDGSHFSPLPPLIFYLELTCFLASSVPSQGSCQRQVQLVASAQKTETPPSQLRAQTMLVLLIPRRCLRQRHPIRIGTTAPFSLPSQTLQCAAESATLRERPFSFFRTQRSARHVCARRAQYQSSQNQNHPGTATSIGTGTAGADVSAPLR